MFESVLRVKYVSFKNCFVYLSPSHQHLSTGMCIKLTYGCHEAYFSGSLIRNTVDDDSIGINSSYAKILGIDEDEFVNVLQLEQLPVVNSITLLPFTKSDYEVLEILSQNVQSNLLDQVRVVNVGQKLIIWIGNNLYVPVGVENIKPIAPGVLDFLTEVIIKPPDKYGINTSKELNTKKGEKGKDNKELVHFFKMKSADSDKLLNGFDETLKAKEILYFRLMPLSELPKKTVNEKYLPPFTAFISKRNAIESGQFFSISLLENSYLEKKLYMKLCYLEEFFDISDEIFNAGCVNNIFVENSILIFMQSDYGTRVVLKKVDHKLSVKEIEVHSRRSYLVNVIEKLKIYLADHCKTTLILNPNYPFKIDEQLWCSLKFLPNSNEFCIIDQDVLRNCSYSLCDDPVRPLENIVIKCEAKNFCLALSPTKDICNKIFSVLFRINYFQTENIILMGKCGMGKTSVLNHISTKLRSYPYFVNTEMVHCKQIKGKTVDSLHKYFADIFAKLVFTQPSLLILDDLHVLCERCEGEETPNSVYFNRVSEMLYDLFSTAMENNLIGILASVNSVSSLNKYIYKSRGNHLFKNVFSLGDLSKTDRTLLLKHFFEQHSVDSLDYDEFAIKTDGFVVQDIEDFYEKALFEAYKELHRKGDEPIIKQEHCDTALKKSCALSLQNVKLHSVGCKTFDDIGGLHHVKSILIESLLWPVKYSSIFVNAPLRLQSGILLYGPPGTGKTLLAGAAAKQCSLRLISIKGPELLSKYIGASEQAVRDIFEKAQRAKPCILFFDEFDSLAPRRGHDNTGVTDRVVNQLLTQLDGVEALTGVCVLAATSRPDLLDPALLRPGRLDKQLLCPMPSQDDRIEILRILSNKINLDEDVNFEEIAKHSDGYSGADIQSVLYTAQISTMRVIDHTSEDITATKISQYVLLEALRKTRPSLGRSERVKYDRIYTKFQGGSTEDFRAGYKVTLA